jgi:hypothetical protein
VPPVIISRHEQPQPGRSSAAPTPKTTATSTSASLPRANAAPFPTLRTWLLTTSWPVCAVRPGGGRTLVGGGRVVAHHAGIAERTVLVEFDSVEQAVVAHESAAYQERWPHLVTASSATSAPSKASTDDRGCVGDEHEAGCGITPARQRAVPSRTASDQLHRAVMSSPATVPGDTAARTPGSSIQRLRPCCIDWRGAGRRLPRPGRARCRRHRRAASRRRSRS